MVEYGEKVMIDMGMPKSCYTCPFQIWECESMTYICILRDDSVAENYEQLSKMDGRPEECPLYRHDVAEV